MNWSHYSSTVFNTCVLWYCRGTVCTGTCEGVPRRHCGNRQWFQPIFCSEDTGWQRWGYWLCPVKVFTPLKGFPSLSCYNHKLLGILILFFFVLSIQSRETLWHGRTRIDGFRKLKYLKWTCIDFWGISFRTTTSCTSSCLSLIATVMSRNSSASVRFNGDSLWS